MIKIVVENLIKAPPERCFDFARDVDEHVKSTAQTKEKAFSDKRMLELGDTVTFEGRHFGIRFRLTSKIVEYNRPADFTDEMTKGPFKSLRHVHRFVATSDGTIATDELTLVAPLGPLGLLAEQLFLKGHLRGLLQARADYLKEQAESPDS